MGKVDRGKGETTLEMVPQFEPPFQQDAFTILPASGNHSFTGVSTDNDDNEYDWRGSTKTAPALAAARAARAGRASVLAAAAPTATMSLQDLDNVSSIQIVTDAKGNQVTVDFAQITCGGYFNKCLVNALDAQWIEGIYGHPYSLPEGAEAVFTTSKQFFHDHAVLGTGQMLYDNLGADSQYKDLLRGMNTHVMHTAWENMGKSKTVGPQYQEASNALYIQGYRDGVAQMKPYLDDPGKWAAAYYDWLTDTANLLTWQIQIASATTPILSAEVPGAVNGTAQALQSAPLRDPFGTVVGVIRFDTRRLGRDIAAQELGVSGLWTEEAAQAYANALGVAMIKPILSRLTQARPATTDG
ncbi:hypothetical protein [Amycolatopsis sp. NBC_00438]|uniref:hypothetical protein n=1 Tax=Amycolatopsis sp. NBC_00438 TaxID=2903558 RepID=UPI002E22F907